MYNDLQDFIRTLEKEGELIRIRSYVDPVLEISEITDRVSKTPGGGKALLFENTGTDFPVATNLMGSDKRICLALGVEALDQIGERIESLFSRLTAPKKGLMDKMGMLPLMGEAARWLPRRLNGRGACQQVVFKGPDVRLSQIPVLQCWPFDGGRFVTLPLVHTLDPHTGIRNVGMYRMQVFSDTTTGLHWHRHKTGERHYQKYRELGKRMPVSVCLGGDPVYTYSATAPLPDGIDEYLLAGFLRRRPVQLVKCLTNDLEVPADCDFVIEGYVDPAQGKVIEGPFGDHTGFYSLEDVYPVFHITCITHRRQAVYPATLVGIPPQEDAYIAKATEKVFLSPIRLAMQPEVRDMYLPQEGVSHNIAVLDIEKSYPGQGFKTASSMWGAGQMMFNKFMFITSGLKDVRDPGQLQSAWKNVNIPHDILLSRGPLDVLDHAAPSMGYGGKICFDATVKLPEEHVPVDRKEHSKRLGTDVLEFPETFSGSDTQWLKDWQLLLLKTDSDRDLADLLKKNPLPLAGIKCVVIFDSVVALEDVPTLLWLAGNNVDPVRDAVIQGNTLIVDARSKYKGLNGFSRRWPNVVTMSTAVIKAVDQKWDDCFPGLPRTPSPSLHYRNLVLAPGAAMDENSGDR